MSPSTITIAVIIPVLNEAEMIAQSLSHLRTISGWNECVVVDGGSRDRSADIAANHNLHPSVLRVSGNRATQLNAALDHVKSDVVVILGADCRLSRRTCDAIRDAVNKGITAGCLRLRSAAHHPIFRWQDRWANIRTCWTSGAYVDQAPFYVRQLAMQHRFRAVGSYDTADLGRRLTKRGLVKVIPATVVASCRHWQRHGFVRGTWMHQWLRLQHWFRHAC